MSNQWITFVKKWAKDNDLSYGSALKSSEMKAEYQKQNSKRINGLGTAVSAMRNAVAPAPPPPTRRQRMRQQQQQQPRPTTATVVPIQAYPIMSELDGNAIMDEILRDPSAFARTARRVLPEQDFNDIMAEMLRRRSF